jgi:hypothetical protein
MGHKSTGKDCEDETMNNQLKQKKTVRYGAITESGKFSVKISM